MAIRIHHTQVKQAAKLGISLMHSMSGMDVSASKDGQSASAPSAGLAIAALLKKLGASTAQIMATLKPEEQLARGKAQLRKAKKARKAAKRRDDDESEDGDDEGKSVIKRKYKQAYQPHRMTCGDALSQQIRKEFMTVKDPDTKKLKLDWKRFTQFAKANGCWSDDYLKLNKGMRRMNVVNRLRAKIAAKHDVVWSA